MTNKLSLLELERNCNLYEWNKPLEFLHGTGEVSEIDLWVFYFTFLSISCLHALDLTLTEDTC